MDAGKYGPQQAEHDGESEDFVALVVKLQKIKYGSRNG